MNKLILFTLLIFILTALSSHAQPTPKDKIKNKYWWIYPSREVSFKQCMLDSNNTAKIITIDTTSLKHNALYSRVGNKILAIQKCGSIYVFPLNSNTTDFTPAFHTQKCHEQFELAKHAIAINNECIFILSNYDSNTINPIIKLLLINLNDASVKVIDKGKIEPNIYYFNNAGALFYTKNGLDMRFEIFGKKPYKIGF